MQIYVNIPDDREAFVVIYSKINNNWFLEKINHPRNIPITGTYSTQQEAISQVMLLIGQGFTRSNAYKATLLVGSPGGNLVEISHYPDAP
jgi:hypothetical protein